MLGGGCPGWCPAYCSLPALPPLTSLTAPAAPKHIQKNLCDSMLFENTNCASLVWKNHCASSPLRVKPWAKFNSEEYQPCFIVRVSFVSAFSACLSLSPPVVPHPCSLFPLLHYLRIQSGSGPPFPASSPFSPLFTAFLELHPEVKFCAK